jgi:Flp pilus assembly pilin Flp
MRWVPNSSASRCTAPRPESWAGWTGGKGVWSGLIAVQVWLILGGLANVANGSGHGFTQLFLPTLILLFLTRAESREWFRLPEFEREEKPGFSLPHMITWRRDRGQTSVEYAGLITVVVAIILALALGGVGGRISDGLQSAICSLTGTACPPTGDGSETAQAGQDPSDATTGGADAGSTGTGGTNGTGGSTGGTDSGTTGTGGTDGGTAGTRGTTGTGGSDGGSTGGTDGGTGGTTGTTGGTDGGPGRSGGTTGTGGSTGGTDSGATGTGGSTGGTGGATGGPGGGTTGGPNSEGDTYPETSTEPEAEYDDIAADTDDSGDGGGGDGGDKGDEEDCGGWGFFGCAWDRGTQVVKGVFVDGIWGDLTGIADLFKAETWSGIADYGSQLGDKTVAKAARKAFREERLPIKVVPTKQKPVGGPRKPEAFD